MNNLEKNTSRSVYKVVALQAGIAIVFAIAATVFFDGGKGVSAAIGGMIAVIGSLIYAVIVTGKSGDAASVMKAHFVAEIVKIFITVVLFLLVLLVFHSVVLLWLILGFAVATLAYWFSLLIV